MREPEFISGAYNNTSGVMETTDKVWIGSNEFIRIHIAPERGI